MRRNWVRESREQFGTPGFQQADLDPGDYEAYADRAQYHSAWWVRQSQQNAEVWPELSEPSQLEWDGGPFRPMRATRELHGGSPEEDQPALLEEEGARSGCPSSFERFFELITMSPWRHNYAWFGLGYPGLGRTLIGRSR